MTSAPAIRTIAPLDRRTLGDRVYGELCDLLVSGRLAPGERLSLRAAAEALGVSIMPVREAVSRLVADRALEVTPNRAVRVPVMSAGGFRELATIRVEIEGFAAQEAARRRKAGDLERIRTAEAAFRRLSEVPDPDLAEAVAVNKDLHFAVYEAAHMPSLVEIIASLWLKAGPVLNLDLRASPDRLVSGGAVRFHREMVEAIETRDGAAARAALSRDITGAADFILARGGLAEDDGPDQANRDR